jgi:hypothetical protein
MYVAALLHSLILPSALVTSILHIRLSRDKKNPAAPNDYPGRCTDSFTVTCPERIKFTFCIFGDNKVSYVKQYNSEMSRVRTSVLFITTPISL